MTISDDMIAQAAYEVDQAIASMFPEPEDCEHTFSASFEKKMKKLIWKADHLVLYKVLQRAACILIALFLSASMFVAFNPEARAAVVDWIQDRFHEFYHYFFVGEENSEETKALEGTASTDGSAGTTEPTEATSYRLGWVPDGFMLLDSFESETGNTYIYVSDAGQMVQFAYLYGTDTNAVFAGGGEYEEKYITVENLKAEVFLALNSEQTNAIVWKGNDGKVIFSISGYLEEADLIKMAQNLIAE